MKNCNYPIIILIFLFSSCSNKSLKQFRVDSNNLYFNIHKQTTQESYLKEIDIFINRKGLSKSYKEKIVCAATIFTILDTLDIPNSNIEKRAVIWGPIIEDRLNPDQIKEYYILKKANKVRWRNYSHSQCHHVKLTKNQIIGIKKVLKKNKLYQGKLNSDWDKNIIKAIKLYQMIYSENNSYRVISNQKKSVNQFTLFQMGLIKKNEMLPYGYNISESELFGKTKTELSKRGYNTKTKGVSVQLAKFIEDNNLGKLNRIEIYKKLGIQIEYVYTKSCGQF